MEQIRKDIRDLIDQIDYNVNNIEQDFEENQDDIRHCIGGTYLKGQLKIYGELRECLEQLLEDEPKTNAEKFEDVFGFTPDLCVCIMDANCPEKTECKDCKNRNWWKEQYKEGNK